MTPTAGLLLGERYELTERLAIGGMGEVWVATDLHLRRNVAVKVLRAEFAGDTHFLDRLRTEARNSAALSHQNIAAMYDYGEQRGSGYLIMELVLGESLEDLLRRERTLEPTQVLPVLAQAARALHTAHMAGVVHRDVKPSNILLTRDGYVKITDFGISLGANQAPMTAAGMVMGTAQYLPPEQAMGRAATGAGDIYALGVVAYEALVGKRPFTGGSQVDIAFAHVNQPIPELPSHLDERVRAVVVQMLAKDPEQRPRSAASLARTLESLTEQLRAPTEREPRAEDDPPATSVAVPVSAPPPLVPVLKGHSHTGEDHGQSTSRPPESGAAAPDTPDTPDSARDTTGPRQRPDTSENPHTLAGAARRGPVRDGAHRSSGPSDEVDDDPDTGDPGEDDELSPRWRPLSATGALPVTRGPAAHRGNEDREEDDTGTAAGSSAPSTGPRSPDRGEAVRQGERAPSDVATSRRELRAQPAPGHRATPQHRPSSLVDRLGPTGRWVALIVAALVLTTLLVLLFSTLGAAASPFGAATAVLVWPHRPLKSRASERVEER
ncbi:serine/threonine-protein kinase [Ruania halotolerans]|uniref:serine/threonine-protein kinase n=1 Tax=Ruania halotolerans TaxID=2897773 RepID=UPI001E30F212|nr:serine/threonine-protein kinase [Ruania halotolerans]UFU06639.1 protein kinase [Ruania halotolerans]